MSSVVESNLIQVKIVERRCSTFLLFEDLSSVVESVWPGAQPSTLQFRACVCAVEKIFPPKFSQTNSTETKANKRESQHRLQ